MSTSSQAEITMAAATAKQAEATASQAVADSTKVASEANPEDTDLAASAILQQEEATKDQADADVLLEIAIAAESSTEVPAEDTQSANQTPEETTAPETVVVPESIAQITETIVPDVVTPAPQVINVGVSAPNEVKVVSPSVTTTATPTVQSVPSLASGTVVNKDSAVASGFGTSVAGLKTTGTFIERNFISQMEKYYDAMKPGTPIDSNLGGRQQIALWRAIQGIIERSGDEFQSAYTLLLAVFEEHKDDVFHEHFVFRFAETITLSNEELATFQQILNLLKLTCDPVGRKHALTQVDLERTMKNNISEQARQKILGFYGK